MYPWYVQLVILLSITIIVYPIAVLIALRYFYFPMLVKSIANECFKLTSEEEEKSLEEALANNLPQSENPLETGDCEVVLGNIVRKDDEADDDEEWTEDRLREYFWG